MELYNSENMELRSQVTNKIPIFEVNNIDPSVPIKLYLYAENAKGTSDPAIIDDSAQNQPKHNVEGKIFISIHKTLSKNSRFTCTDPDLSSLLLFIFLKFF